MEEIVAIFAVCLLTGVGWVTAKLCFAKVISGENCIYFAPALGAGICGVVSYVAIHTYQPSLIGAFCVAVAIVAVLFRKRLHTSAWRRGGSAAPRGPTLNADTGISSSRRALDRPEWRLFRFTVLTFFSLYGMQIALYGLFSRLYPGPHEVWTLFNMTGTPPPDQMFAWHQAMFADQHRHYPADVFMLDMDLYDRPHLGGYITLFFFKLLGLPLTEDHLVYPPDGLHFYHCLWWLLNNLYLLGVAPLFRRLFAYRGAIIAVATTALGGFFFICTAGSWTKFVAAYPFLLAFLLYLENRGPLLQAALCAVSYYIHGSVLPFLAGFGLLQILNLRWSIGGRRLSIRTVGMFATSGVILVGAWFIVIRWVGSRQPLFYHFLYNADLTAAQTAPIAELARAFYDKHSWANLSLSPVRSLLASWLPLGALQTSPASLSGLADTSFAWQRFCIECGLGVVAAPVVIAGLFKALARKHAGKAAICLYLVPTLLVALLYHIDWAFSLHILILYHTICLFLWVTMLERRSTRIVMLGLSLVGLEGVLCVLFADIRLLPVHGLDLPQIPGRYLWFVAAYLLLVVSILIAAGLETMRTKELQLIAPTQFGAWKELRLGAVKVAIGVAIIAVVIGVYSIYCLRFYPR
ncbi:MAG: hypothetical protein ACJ8M4_00795 [Chthoniobacterales bacterium]